MLWRKVVMIVNLGEVVLCGKPIKIEDIPFQTEYSLEELKKKLRTGKENKFLNYNTRINKYNFENINNLCRIFGQNINELTISNFGQIRYKNKLLEQSLVKDGRHKGFMGGIYDSYLEINFERFHLDNWIFLVHRLVAEYWCKNIDPCVFNIVHHLNNDGFDNRVDNLIWVTNEQHNLIHN
jgi:hypothetical protein